MSRLLDHPRPLSRAPRGPIALRSPEQIESMRRAGRVVAAALRAARDACVPGATTAEIDAAAAATIEAAGGTPLFLNYPTYEPGSGFPASTCISVEEEVVHGVPGRRVVRAGELVSIDCGVRLAGWCADAATTVAVGAIDDDRRRLLDATRDLLDLAIAAIRPGVRWSTIARAIESRAAASGFGMVRDYVGHGIGRELHEAPEVPCGVVAPGRVGDRPGRDGWLGDFTLRAGMTIAIEPMLVLGSPETVEHRDGWTVSTADGLPACHFEHTVAVSADGADILTPESR